MSQPAGQRWQFTVCDANAGNRHCDRAARVAAREWMRD
jgi:hypothetical protein